MIEPDSFDEKILDPNENEDEQIERKFQLATEGIKMPPAPKGKTEPKFAFGDMSESEDEEMPENKPVRNFGIDLDSDEDKPMMIPPTKKGYGLLGADAKKFMNDQKKAGNLEINLNEGND